MKKTPILWAALGCAALAGCAAVPAPAEIDAITERLVREAFRTRGIAQVERVTAVDDSLKACSAGDARGKGIDSDTAAAIQAVEMQTIRWPSDGKFIGDWKQGEAIAQSGRGLTWTDSASMANGGNCYNCHQIDKKEISFGTLGPSLYNYGKLRGVTDPNSPAFQGIVQYTWGKIYNSKAYNACSNMPRAGHMGILTEQQIRHVMALLLDPKSPVNQ